MVDLVLPAGVGDERDPDPAAVDVDLTSTRADCTLVPGATGPVQRPDELVLAEADMSDLYEGP
ncbi:hypothetical protein AFR_12300 [Actinoplanes friuliensis DSM 7358]|uniref:Uncharacterized protein n=1 Tax=Actinoplanes friuliensis DSM 7358 TaxID=1246995 RepID=U5VYL1_9ACTN|nr:hypothetical protein [Actinoplanes friuliensis]AGZ40746.1 hypothetical protein AFR_12300 [Actinoplanes friuliensis DSM 7358]